MNKFHPQVKPHPGDPRYVKQQYAAKISRYRASIILFIEDMWGLTPQGVKPAYRERWQEVKLATGSNWLHLKDQVSAEWFGDKHTQEDGTTFWVWHDFTKGKNISWQQTLILMGIEKSIQDKRLSRHFSIRSGHGIGKSATTSWIVLWFLYCYFMAQVPVTAPTSGQMHDVLWKELAIWINRMPETVKDIYEWQHDYVRIRYEPESWFARAKTSSKENTEALAGVHAEHVLIAVDEASGVPEQVFNTAEGALTSGNVFVILISNPTRTMGYFYDSHHKNAADWQVFNFNCEEAPLVDRQYVTRQAKRHGVTSDEYRIRVKGEFPSEDMMDDSGYLQLIPRPRIIVIPSLGAQDLFIGRKRLAIDPSGEGSDQCEFVLRDGFRAKNILTLQTTNDKEIAEYIIKFADQFGLKGRDITIEGFGKGADAAKHVAVNTKGKLSIYVVLPGNAPKYEEEINGEHFNRLPGEYDDNLADLFLNIRAVMNWRMRNWLLAGGQIIDNNTENSDFAEQISVNKIKRTLQGNKMQMMPKQEMNKLRIPSPNKSDALALTFLTEEIPATTTLEERRQIIEAQASAPFDPFSIL